MKKKSLTAQESAKIITNSIKLGERLAIRFILEKNLKNFKRMFKYIKSKYCLEWPFILDTFVRRCDTVKHFQTKEEISKYIDTMKKHIMCAQPIQIYKEK